MNNCFNRRNKLCQDDEWLDNNTTINDLFSKHAPFKWFSMSFPPIWPRFYVFHVLYGSLLFCVVRINFFSIFLVIGFRIFKLQFSIFLSLRFAFFFVVMSFYLVPVLLPFHYFIFFNNFRFSQFFYLIFSNFFHFYSVSFIP